MLAQEKKTLVLGASDNPGRYSFLAINRLRGKGHPVVAIGQRQVMAGDVAIETEKKPFEGVDTVTLYLNSTRQKEYYTYILSLHPETHYLQSRGRERRVTFRVSAGQQAFKRWKRVRWLC